MNNKNYERQLEQQKRKHALRRLMIDALKARPCADCGGVFPPECMDFDHRDPATKVHEVTAMMRGKWELVLEEIAKCDLVCSNCHRTRSKVRDHYHLGGRPRKVWPS